MLMLLEMVNVHMCGLEKGKRGSWGSGKGAEKGWLILSMGSAKAEVRFLLQRATIPSKRV
jgi:hypothetical protein